MLKKIVSALLCGSLLASCQGNLKSDDISGGLVDGGSKIYRHSETEVYWMLVMLNTSSDYICVPNRTFAPHPFFINLKVEDLDGHEIPYSGAIPFTNRTSVSIEMIQPGQSVGVSIYLTESYELPQFFSVEETIVYARCDQIMNLETNEPAKYIFDNFRDVFNEKVVVKGVLK